MQCVSKTVRDIFRLFDDKGNGTLDKYILQRVLTRCGCGTDNEVDALVESFERSDAKGTFLPAGSVQYEAFFNWLFEITAAPSVKSEQGMGVWCSLASGNIASYITSGPRLTQRGKVLAEYVWLGGAYTTGGFDIRQKTKSLSRKPTILDDLPIWNYDGSSTGQAPGADSEALLKPVRMYPDPFRGGDNLLVLCECLDPKMRPLPTNTRAAAADIFNRKLGEVPWFGIEQEYTLFEKDNTTPLGWPEGGFPAPQGPYYCSLGTDVSFGRDVMEAHYEACLYANVAIAGTNAEVMPGQWEYQIGPCEGILSGDDVWMSRYLLIRVCEAQGVNICFDPKPIPGDWNGAGCHTNYSTERMREKGGYREIIAAIEKLAKKHEEHIRVYGEGNERRLTGRHETASIDRFSYGVANRGASVRIPRTAERDQCGYFEDRRPASNMDPYVVTSKIFKTTCIE